MESNDKLSRENALNKVRKLFSLATAKNVANEAEAESALRKAQQMMAEYSIREFEIHAGIVDDMAKDIVGRMFCEQPRTMLEDKFIIGIVIRFFNVKIVLKGGSSVYAVGSETHLDIAENAFWYLRTVFRSLWLKYYYSLPVRERTTSLKQPYYGGLRAGLYERLEEEKVIIENSSASTAIVMVHNALQKKFNQMFPCLTNKTYAGYRQNTNGFEAGKRDSAEINIRKGISSGYSKPMPKIGGNSITL